MLIDTVNNKNHGGTISSRDIGNSKQAQRLNIDHQ